MVFCLRLEFKKRHLQFPNVFTICFYSFCRVLIGQQRTYIDKHCGGRVIVREYVGDTSKGGRKVDEWTAENWQRELEETDVMVIIPQIMKMLLQRALLPISAFDLIVLDECHHAFGNIYIYVYMYVYICIHMYICMYTYLYMPPCLR
jgi:ERCC4-related helicase